MPGLLGALEGLRLLWSLSQCFLLPRFSVLTALCLGCLVGESVLPLSIRVARRIVWIYSFSYPMRSSLRSIACSLRTSENILLKSWLSALTS